MKRSKISKRNPFEGEQECNYQMQFIKKNYSERLFSFFSIRSFSNSFALNTYASGDTSKAKSFLPTPVCPVIKTFTGSEADILATFKIFFVDGDSAINFSILFLL